MDSCKGSVGRPWPHKEAGILRAGSRTGVDFEFPMLR